MSERLKEEHATAGLSNLGASEVAATLTPGFGTIPKLNISKIDSGYEFRLPEHHLGNYMLMRLSDHSHASDLPFLSEDLQSQGKIVSSDGDGSWRVSIPTQRVERFSLFRQCDGIAQMGKPIELSWLPDVTNLAAHRDGDGVILSWEWPPKVKRALVKVWSTHRMDTIRITKPNYLLGNGVVYPLGLSVPEKELNIQVLTASLRRGNEFFHSPGIESSCKINIRLP